MSASPRFAAPTDDGSVLAVPPLDRIGEVLPSNRLRLASGIRVLGRPLADLQHQARREILEQARAYLAEAGEPVPAHRSDRLILAGHQPEMFHPGVWVKNFALHGLARKHGLTPLNLVVDNDIVKNTLVKLPVAAPRPHLASIPFDRAAKELPYEERGILDEQLFNTFPARAAEHTSAWIWKPLLDDLWQQLPRQGALGERLAAGRRSLERRWGCHNLEVPVSRLCQTGGFAWFACHLLENLASFHAIYNEAVADYRRRNRVRNVHHPVPDLAREGEWLEVPFWVWRVDRPLRNRLFARRAGAGIDLRGGSDPLPSLSASTPEGRVAAWQALEGAGHKVRCRALTTTLFARLFLGELFIHGIGGARYDELTDVLIERFFGMPPPAYLVLSATRLLPFPRSAAAGETCRELARLRRDCWWNPQRHLAGIHDPVAAQLALEKQRAIDRPGGNRARRKARFLELRALNARLQERVVARQRRLDEELARCRQALDAKTLFTRRDFAFCLYPEPQLHAFFDSVLDGLK